MKSLSSRRAFAFAVLCLSFHSLLFADAAAAKSQVKFARKWNESSASLNVAVENTAKTPLAIEGVQTSANLYVVSFPATIRPGASANLVLRYVARPGASGDVDTVRLLTNQGEKIIEVTQDRESAFTLDPQSLGWTVGEKAAPKAAILTVRQPGLSASAVRVFGDGANRAELQEITPGRYQITITPAATDSPAHFAVMVEMTPEVAGHIPVIQCAVAKAK